MKQTPLKRTTPLRRSGLKAKGPGGKGSSLKRGRPKLTPGYDYASFVEGIADRDGADCFVRRYVPMDPALLACDGKLDGHHVGLSKQWLKGEFPQGGVPDPRGGLIPLFRVDPSGPDRLPVTSLPSLLNDSRNGILVCRRHHDLLENARIALSAEVLPGCVFEFAAELGDRAVARLERDYGTTEREAA